jgi:hypothetical protein
MSNPRGLILAAIGAAWFAISVRALRHRAWQDGVPAAELIAAKVIGEAPAPRTKWDRRLALFHVCAGLIFGSLLIFGGLTVAFAA